MCCLCPTKIYFIPPSYGQYRTKTRSALMTMKYFSTLKNDIVVRRWRYGGIINYLNRLSMPTIYKPKHQKPNEGNRKERMSIYNTARWRELRVLKFKSNPLCEMCLKADRITPADDIHHIVSFMTTYDPVQRTFLAFDFDNLMSLCDRCHQAIHNRSTK